MLKDRTWGGILGLWIALSLTSERKLSALEFAFEFTPTISAWQEGTPAEQTLFGLIEQVLEEATETWCLRLKDDIRIHLVVDGKVLSPHIFANALGESILVSYDEFRQSLVMDATSEADEMAIKSLPMAAPLEFYIRNEMGELRRDTIEDSDPNNNESVLVSVPVGLALGLLDPDSSHNAAVLSVNTFFPAEAMLIGGDFDRSDGLEPGRVDIVTVVEHEIGHALGFTGGPRDWPFVKDGILPLDFFRYERLEEDEGPVRVVTELGGETEAYFSVDGGETALALFGDRSHWKSTPEMLGGRFRETTPWGVMGQFAKAGERYWSSQLDLLALDVIGFDLDPRFAPRAAELRVQNREGQIALEFESTRVGARGGTNLVPDYRLQTSQDLQSWNDFGDLVAGGLQETALNTIQVPVLPKAFFRLNEQVTIPDANLVGANLLQARLAGANLQNANLEKVDLRESHLDEAVLRGANLTDARFDFASLRGADLSNCQLEHATFFGADLTGVDFDGAQFKDTIMEDGSVRNPSAGMAP